MSIYIPTLGEILTVSHGRGTMSRAPGLWRDLVRVWPMQEGGGTTAFDVSGYGKHGTLTNMDPATDWVVGEKGRALDFDADNDHITLPVLDDFQVWSVGGWVWLDSPMGDNFLALWSRTDGADQGSILMLAKATQKFRFYGWDTTWRYVEADATSSLEAWHHVVGTCDGATLRLFVDGKQQSGTATVTGGQNWGIISAHHLGRYAANYYLGGLLTNVMLHTSRALAPSEIQQLYADPWAMYTLRPRVFAAAAVAGGVSEITGTCAIAVTPSGALTGAGALAGSVAIAATPSGSMVGSGALAGSSAVAVTPSGALAGSGALLGSAAVAVTPTGALSGAGALAGSSTVAVTPSGALAGSGALSGSAAVAVTPSGSLAGSGALAGSSAISVTLSGTLAGGGIVPFLSVLYSQAG